MQKTYTMTHISNEIITAVVNKHHEQALAMYRSAQYRERQSVNNSLRPCAIGVMVATSLLSACTNMGTLSESKGLQPTLGAPRQMIADRPTLTRLETQDGVSLLFPLTPTPKTIAIAPPRISRVDEEARSRNSGQADTLKSLPSVSAAVEKSISETRSDAVTTIALPRDRSAVGIGSAVSTNEGRKSQNDADMADNDDLQSASTSTSDGNGSNVLTSQKNARTTLNHYKTGHYELDSVGALVIQRLAASVGSYSVVITGYTDRFGSVEANRPLALARAIKVKQAFEKHGVKPSQIRIFYCTDCFDDRRVDFYLTEEAASSIVDPMFADKASRVLTKASSAERKASESREPSLIAKK
jgi:outer membrane protein OmpA-like peptidoglycan-associated protein